MWYARHLLIERFNKMGDEVVEYFMKTLPEALEKFDTVYLATHVPPWEELCTYDGKPSDIRYLPFYSCKVLRDYLVQEMAKWPSKKLEVLCGHTHSREDKQISENIHARMRAAKYGLVTFEVIEV